LALRVEGFPVVTPLSISQSPCLTSGHQGRQALVPSIGTAGREQTRARLRYRQKRRAVLRAGRESRGPAGR